MRFAALLTAALLAGVAVRTAAAPPAQPGSAALVNCLESRFESLDDYECVMESEVQGKKSKSKGTYRIWFRKPSLFRLKVLKGRHEGTEFAVTPAGKIRAKPSGLLGKVVTKEFSKTDSRFLSPRGVYAWDTDLGSQCKRLRERLRLAEKCEVRADPESPSITQVDFCYRSPGQDERIREVWSIDTNQRLLIGQDVYENDLQVERVRFREFRDNLGLEDRFFKL